MSCVTRETILEKGSPYIRVQFMICNVEQQFEKPTLESNGYAKPMKLNKAEAFVDVD